MNVSAGNIGEKRARAAKKRRICVRCVYGRAIGQRQKKALEFLFGGIGYGLIELIWRGRTHWSMVLTGGICMLAICAVNECFAGKHLLLRACICAAAITLAEFCVGLAVNLALGLGVWDYSGMFGNVLGQICPLYSFLWFLLSIPICWIECRMKNAE